MAEATITKTIGDGTRNCYATLSWTQLGAEYDYMWINSGRTTGSNTGTADFSVIPADAVIISATYNSNYTESLSGSGYQTIRKANGDMWDYANSANLKRWLTAGNRTVKIMYSYTPNEQAPRGASAGPGATSAYRTYRNISMTVKYEAGTKTWLLHYGIGNDWEQVEAYVCEEGTYKPVKAYYGTNGGWVLCENHDIEGT